MKIKRFTFITGIAVLLLFILLLFGFSTIPSPERFIVGKGMDTAGNTWLVVSTCESCEKEWVEVTQLDAYKIGDKFP